MGVDVNLHVVETENGNVFRLSGSDALSFNAVSVVGDGVHSGKVRVLSPSGDSKLETSRVDWVELPKNSNGDGVQADAADFQVGQKIVVRGQIGRDITFI
jgi:hypothetical protein